MTTKSEGGGSTPSTPVEQESWNLEAVYDEEISPLMTQIIAICRQHRLPMMASFAFGNDAKEERTDYCTTALLGWPERKPEPLLAAVRTIREERPVSWCAITISSGEPGAAPSAPAVLGKVK